MEQIKSEVNQYMSGYGGNNVNGMEFYIFRDFSIYKDIQIQ